MLDRIFQKKIIKPCHRAYPDNEYFDRVLCTFFLWTFYAILSMLFDDIAQKFQIK